MRTPMAMRVPVGGFAILFCPGGAAFGQVSLSVTRLASAWEFGVVGLALFLCRETLRAACRTHRVRSPASRWFRGEWSRPAPFAPCALPQLVRNCVRLQGRARAEQRSDLVGSWPRRLTGNASGRGALVVWFFVPFLAGVFSVLWRRAELQIKRALVPDSSMLQTQGLGPPRWRGRATPDPRHASSHTTSRQATPLHRERAAKHPTTRHTSAHRNHHTQPHRRR